MTHVTAIHDVQFSLQVSFCLLDLINLRIKNMTTWCGSPRKAKQQKQVIKADKGYIHLYS